MINKQYYKTSILRYSLYVFIELSCNIFLILFRLTFIWLLYPLQRIYVFTPILKYFFFSQIFFSLSPEVKLFKNLFIFWIIKLPLDTIKDDRFHENFAWWLGVRHCKKKTKLVLVLNTNLDQRHSDTICDQK